VKIKREREEEEKKWRNRKIDEEGS